MLAKLCLEIFCLQHLHESFGLQRSPNYHGIKKIDFDIEFKKGLSGF
jgi:hypothetical protein